MEIGIGVTSYQRPDMLNRFLESIHKYTSSHRLYVAIDTDKDRHGVAKRKNECLRHLQDCDHVFLFDDDVKILKKGWTDFFINSGEQHLLYLNDNLHTPYYSKGKITYYKDCGGVFMYMTKSAIEKVGAFNERFNTYGFEHAEYSIRILGRHGHYPMLKGTTDYLYAEDYNNNDHKSSITDFEKSFYYNQNKSIFAQPITTIYRPL